MKTFLLSIFTLSLSLSLASAAPSRSKVVYEYELPNFEMEFQDNAPWCWASAAKMVLNHLKIKAKTCEVVSKTFGRNCCKIFSSTSCWQGGNAVHGLAQYGVHYKYVQFVANSESTALLSHAEEIVRQIRRGNMPILNFKNVIKGNPGHAAVVTGVDGVHNPSTLRFHIGDSAIGHFYLPARDLLRGYYRVGNETLYLSGIQIPQ